MVSWFEDLGLVVWWFGGLSIPAWPVGSASLQPDIHTVIGWHRIGKVTIVGSSSPLTIFSGDLATLITEKLLEARRLRSLCIFPADCQSGFDSRLSILQNLMVLTFSRYS